jgi:Cu2+-exporting ATPase
VQRVSSSHDLTWPELAPTLTPVQVVVDGVLVAVAGLGDQVRADALPALQQLRASGWRTLLLSGDTADVATAVGQSLGFAANEVTGGASPEDKLRVVEQLKMEGTVVMVGDGVNDAAAIAAAHVGVGVHGGAEACLSTADVYLTQPGLSALVGLHEGARNTLRVIRRNIALSIGYNIVGASLAVAGILSPLIAAVLMPLSSITVVLGSWYGHSFPRHAPSRSTATGSAPSALRPAPVPQP